MVENKVYINIPKSRTNVSIRTNQMLNRYDRFNFTITITNRVSPLMIIEPIMKEISYLHNDSPRQVTEFIISGDPELVDMILDSEKLPEPKSVNEKRALAYITQALMSKTLNIHQ